MPNKRNIPLDDALPFQHSKYTKYIWVGAALVVGVLLMIPILGKSVPVGHVAVATLFGRPVEKTFEEGLHFPVNPLYAWHEFDVRQDSWPEKRVEIPSQDQLTTQVDVSVQFRVNRAKVVDILRDTGDRQQLIQVHLVPKLRSLLREQGKSVKRAEDFFNESTQINLQQSLQRELAAYVEPRGLQVTDVLLRDIQLPATIKAGVEDKKRREQEGEKQKAELDRFRTEQQQKIAQAEAERSAAEEQAKMMKLLADAEAYKIERISQAMAGNSAYVQLQALEALKSISKDPATKLIFMDGQSPMPLPLMHMGLEDTKINAALTP